MRQRLGLDGGVPSLKKAPRIVRPPNMAARERSVFVLAEQIKLGFKGGQPMITSNTATGAKPSEKPTEASTYPQPPSLRIGLGPRAHDNSNGDSVFDELD